MLTTQPNPPMLPTQVQTARLAETLTHWCQHTKGSIQFSYSHCLWICRKVLAVDNTLVLLYLEKVPITTDEKPTIATPVLALTSSEFKDFVHTAFLAFHWRSDKPADNEPHVK
jgi:hypothetical protein